MLLQFWDLVHKSDDDCVGEGAESFILFLYTVDRMKKYATTPPGFYQHM